MLFRMYDPSSKFAEGGRVRHNSLNTPKFGLVCSVNPAITCVSVRLERAEWRSQSRSGHCRTGECPQAYEVTRSYMTVHGALGCKPGRPIDIYRGRAVVNTALAPITWIVCTACSSVLNVVIHTWMTSVSTSLYLIMSLQLNLHCRKVSITVVLSQLTRWIVQLVHADHIVSYTSTFI